MSIVAELKKYKSKYYVTWCDGKFARLTPVDGFPFQSYQFSVDDFDIIEGEEEFRRMVNIFGNKT